MKMVHYSENEMINFQETTEFLNTEFYQHLQNCPECYNRWEELQCYKQLWNEEPKQLPNHNQLWQNILHNIPDIKHTKKRTTNIKETKTRINPTYVNLTIAVAACTIFFNTSAFSTLTKIDKHFITITNFTNKLAIKDILHFDFNLNIFTFNNNKK